MRLGRGGGGRGAGIGALVAPSILAALPAPAPSALAHALAVLPVPDLPGEARPHAQRYEDITRQLADRVRRDLQRSWSLPGATSGAPSLNIPQVPSGRSGPLPEAPSR